MGMANKKTPGHWYAILVFEVIALVFIIGIAFGALLFRFISPKETITILREPKTEKYLHNVTCEIWSVCDYSNNDEYVCNEERRNCHDPNITMFVYQGTIPEDYPWLYNWTYNYTYCSSCLHHMFNFENMTFE